MQTRDESTSFFWELATPLLEDPEITRSTMMGYPCLRVADKFFASVDPRTGDLVIKLPAPRVLELIEQGVGTPFSPAGRRFREWVVLAGRDQDQWGALMAESRCFVEQA